MRVLQALFFPPEQPGGVSSMIPDVQERFTALGWQMDLFWLPKRIRNKGEMSFQFTTFPGHEFGGAIVEKYIQTMRDYMWWASLRLQRPYDVIHAHHPIAALTMKRLFPHTPVLMTVHSSYETELRLNGRIVAGGIEEHFLTALYHEMEVHVDRLLTVSHAFKQYLAPYVRDPSRIAVLHNGFDERRFKPVAHENAVAQLITMCRLVPAKGLDILIQACAQLKARGVPFMLHMIGDGPMRIPLEEMARQYGVYDDILFYGYMLHPEQFMPFFDIFVLPSRAEAFGNVFAEAALCWLARIGTEIGGIREQITHGVNGLLVPVDDVQALANALQTVIDDRAYQYALSRAAWHTVKQTYSLERVMHQLEQLYRSVGEIAE
jgi:glycosyltransferase involved in cell wall biosynthesis